MGQRTRSPLPPRVNRVRVRIERWRRQRTQPSPMPEELWASAVSLARRHGVYPIARALRIDYGALKKRITPRPQVRSKIRKTEFIELGPAPLLGHLEPAGMVVELSDEDGAKLVMRLPAGDSVDVERLVAAFWSRRG